MSLETNADLGTAIPPVKPRKPRAKKPAAPKVERAKRTTPARTLKVRIAELGPCYPEAFALLCKKDPMHADSIRDALDAAELLVKKQAALVVARNEVLWAEQRVTDTQVWCDETRPSLTRLDAVAKSLAHALGELPDAPTDADRKGVEMPE